jgi:hypothetical protein
MQPKRKRLEVTRLLWDFTSDRMSTQHWGFDTEAPEKKRHYAILADHDCSDAGRRHACGLCVTDICVDLGDNGKGVCEINHPEFTKSGSAHELDVMRALAANIFDGRKGEDFHVGGGGVTYVNFVRGRNQHSFLNVGMGVFEKVCQLFSRGFSSEMRGPQICRKTYYWSIEAQGWIALEDLVAREHGLWPFNSSRSGCNPRDIRLYSKLSF